MDVFCSCFGLIVLGVGLLMIIPYGVWNEIQKSRIEKRMRRERGWKETRYYSEEKGFYSVWEKES